MGIRPTQSDIAAYYAQEMHRYRDLYKAALADVFSAYEAGFAAKEISMIDLNECRKVAARLQAAHPESMQLAQGSALLRDAANTIVALVEHCQVLSAAHNGWQAYAMEHGYPVPPADPKPGEHSEATTPVTG